LDSISKPERIQSAVERKNFVVIACRVDFLDWLYVNAPGHRRDQFFRNDNLNPKSFSENLITGRACVENTNVIQMKRNH
jgi:hypothetical protein